MSDVVGNVDVVALNIRTDGTGRLILKLVEIMGQCRFIPKSGWNDFHKYWYATEADVSAAIAPLMVERKLLMIPNVSSQDVMKVTTAKGKEEVLWTGLMTFTMIDGETGETLSFRMSGQGQDPGDKAAYKGQTGCQKYAALKLFQVETGLDPENENGRESGEPQNRPGPQKGPNKQPPRSGQSNTQQRGKKPSSGQNEQPGGHKDNTPLPPLATIEKIPEYEDVMALAKMIGWDRWGKVQEAVNALRKKRGVFEIKRWNGLDHAWKVEVYNIIRERVRKGKTSQDPKQPLATKQQQPPQSVPDAGDIAELLGLIGTDFNDFINWVNRMRELQQQPKVNGWDDLADPWKIIVFEKLHERLNKMLGGNGVENDAT